MLVVLRLLCLISSTYGGLPKKHSDALRTEFLAAYGHQHLLTLNHLERAGMRQGGPAVAGCTLRSHRPLSSCLVCDV